MSDLRERVLSWIAEQERVCAEATPGPWHAPGMGELHRADHAGLVDTCCDPDAVATGSDLEFMASSRTGYPQALAALRVCVVMAHREYELRRIAEKLGIKP